MSEDRGWVERLLVDGQGRVRGAWRILLYLAAVLVASLAAMLLPRGGLEDAVSLLRAAAAYLALCIAALVPAWGMLRLCDRVSPKRLGLALHRRWWLELGQGLLLGILLMGLVVVVQWSCGWVTIVVLPPRWQEGLAVVLATAPLLLLAATFEELLFRGYAFQVLCQSLGRWAAAGSTSVLFGLAHGANPGATWLSLLNTTLAGLLLALAYLRVRSLWLPVALHFGWNYAQGVLFGLPVSGLELPASLVATELTPECAHWVLLSGGDYGPEAGLVLTICVLAAMASLRLPAVRPADDALVLWS